MPGDDEEVDVNHHASVFLRCRTLVASLLYVLVSSWGCATTRHVVTDEHQDHKNVVLEIVTNDGQRIVFDDAEPHARVEGRSVRGLVNGVLREFDLDSLKEIRYATGNKDNDSDVREYVVTGILFAAIIALAWVIVFSYSYGGN